MKNPAWAIKKQLAERGKRAVHFRCFCIKCTLNYRHITGGNTNSKELSWIHIFFYYSAIVIQTKNAFELTRNIRRNWSRFEKKSVQLGKWEVHGFIKDIHRKLDENKYLAVWLAWCQTMPQDANMQSIYIYFDCKLTRYLSLSQKTNCHEEI